MKKKCPICGENAHPLVTIIEDDGINDDLTKCLYAHRNFFYGLMDYKKVKPLIRFNHGKKYLEISIKQL